MPVSRHNRPARPASADDRAVAQAKAAIEAGRVVEAEQLVRDILARKPGHRAASHVLGVALLAQGRADEAIALLEIAGRDGSDPVVETHLAMALRKAGRANDAMACLERAVTREPSFPPAFHELGTLLDSLNQFERAEAVLRKGLKLSPAAPDTWCALGGVLLMRGDRDGAQMAFARALVERRGHPGALFGQACVLRDNADFARAADLYREVLRQDAERADARLQLGYCLLELGEWEDAIGSLRAAVAIEPRLYEKACQILVRSARGRFWLRPSALAKILPAPLQA
jgi:tetratricopeptide (TPR) repeat protein